MSGATSSPASAAGRPIETRVDGVTLYHRGATVRRVAQLDFTGGVPRDVFVADLPLSLVDHTVRLRVEGDGGQLIVSNVHVGLYAPPRGTPPIPVADKLLREVRSALELARMRTSQLEWEFTRFAQLPVLPRPEPEEGRMPGPSPTAARAALEQVAEQAMGRRVDQLRALRVEVKGLVEREAELVRRQQLASTATRVKPDELRKSVRAQVAPGSTAMRGRLVLEYFVPGARWAPAYQCRMSRDCRQADLQLRAMVCQRTGEDWGGVVISVSTASPLEWTELPTLAALKIGRAQPPAPGARRPRPPPQGGASLFSDFDRAMSQARASLPVVAQWQPPELSLAPAAHFELPSGGAHADQLLGAMDAGEEPQAELMEKGARGGPSDDEAELEVPRQRSASPKKMAAPPPAPAVMRSMARADFAAPGGAMAMLQVEVLHYATLRLEAASHGAGRGRLSPVNRRQVFLESLAALGLTADFDVLSVVEHAERSAQVDELEAPRGSADVRGEAGWYDYVYTTDAAVDVPSDGTFHSVPVNTRRAEADVLYVVVPREDPQVFRQAGVRNPLSSPLLPGPCEVYVGGEYVLTTALPSVAAGADFKLSLGVEQAIRVARNTRFKEQRSGDKVVATNELIHDVDIEVVNNLDRDAACEVRERLPQPAAEAEVVVEEGRVSPEWEPYRQEERGAIIEGGRRWKLTVKPGQSVTVAAQYRVKLYANNELVGGNRREA